MINLWEGVTEHLRGEIKQIIEWKEQELSENLKNSKEQKNIKEKFKTDS